jgi:hypothetical protein
MFDRSGCRDPVDRIVGGIAELAGEERAHWPAPALSERVLELLAAQERLNAEVVRLVGEWDRRRAWESDGALTATSWITHRAPVAGRHAATMVGAARLVDRHPATAAALASGDVSSAHVEQLARVVTKDRAGLYLDHETELLNAAATLPLGDFAKVTATWRSLADDHLASDDHQQQYEARRFHVSDTFQGAVAADGMFDQVGGATLKAAVDDLANLNRQPGDSRTLPQRRADALVELAERYLKGTQPVGRSPVNLNVIVIVDAATVTNQPSELVKVRCEVDGVGPITRAALELLACDCTVTRVVMAGQSQVLDMGRRTRLVTTTQRRALAVRDRHCRFPGCRRPAHWTDAHHIISWLSAWSSRSELPGVGRRPTHHHTIVHTQNWLITRHPNGDIHFTPPRTHDPPAQAA